MWADWHAPDFPLFTSSAEGVFSAEHTLEKGHAALRLYQGDRCWQPAEAIRLNQTLSLAPCQGEAPDWHRYRAGLYQARIDTRSGTPTLTLSVHPQATTKLAVRRCPRWNGDALTVPVAGAFADGTSVRDFYSGQIVPVKQGTVTLQPAAGSNGLLLLESAETRGPAAFDWHNATVYFVLVDRFANGDPSNDNSYGRHRDGLQEIGTFHGGDLRGLTAKLDYLQRLGVNALWISSPLEQIHGWVGGGAKGDFPHYAYHGYYPLDWTRLDANMGSEQDLRALVDGAHQRGIRVLFDVVMNHTGYATLADMQQYQFGALYLKGAALQQTLGQHWGIGAQARGRIGIALTITSISVIVPPGNGGGARAGYVAISATTTLPASRISPCRSPSCRMSRPSRRRRLGYRISTAIRPIRVPWPFPAIPRVTT
ncbi:Alpha-amylase precursor [Edwardsiella tarda]|nr:Alpha-amylase precursor [Edwardsiella tarda]